MTGDRRWPRRVYGVGEEPDPRFSLANERTFLAWARTALALLAAGVAFDALADNVSAAPRRVVAALLVVLGIGVAGSAFARWAATERALRLRRPLPPPLLAPLLAYAVVALGVTVLVLELL